MEYNVYIIITAQQQSKKSVPKPLDIAELSCLTRLFNVAWRTGTVPAKWQTGVMVPILKKGGMTGVLKLSGYHTIQLSLERLFQDAGMEAPTDCQTSDPGGTMQIMSWSCINGPAHYPYGVTRGSWEFAH